MEKRDLTHGGGWVPAVTYVDPRKTSVQVPRLSEGTKYEFRVRAENLQGKSEPLEGENPIVAKNQFGACSVLALSFAVGVKAVKRRERFARSHCGFLFFFLFMRNYTEDCG